MACRRRRSIYPRLSIVVLADRYDTRDVLTLDERHFRTLRTSNRKCFQILPADR